MSLGAGLSKLADKVFRIGHLGHFNDLMLAGTLAGVEMGLALSDVPHRRGGLMAALDSLAKNLSLHHVKFEIVVRRNRFASFANK